jgi:hypothetical protein
MKQLSITFFFVCTTLLSCTGSNKTTASVVNKSLTKTVKVNSASQLKDALIVAKPGDEIVLADGIYSGNFIINNDVSGTSTQPIIIKGSRNAVLDGSTINTGYVLHVKANYWIIKGMTIRNGLKGIMTDEANHNLIDSVKVYNIGEEGIHLRRFSKHNIIQNCEVYNTGLKTPDYGEGIYVGTAVSNWAKSSNGVEDRSDSNIIQKNTIGPNCTAECIDVKEGTTGTIIRANKFNSTGITGANSGDSWIDVKGNYCLIENNYGFNPQGSILKDGYQVHCAVDGWGCYNIFKNNNSVVNAKGYGINITLTSSKGKAVGNKVFSNNKVENADKGVSNIELSN